MTKSILKALAVSFVLSLAVGSCSLLEDCKTCTLYCGGTAQGSGVVYCDDKLKEIENETVTIGGETCSYDCN